MNSTELVHTETTPQFGYKLDPSNGGMAEWTKAAVLKTAIWATVSWVRIPLPPPSSINCCRPRSKEATLQSDGPNP